MIEGNLETRPKSIESAKETAEYLKLAEGLDLSILVLDNLPELGIWF